MNVPQCFWPNKQSRPHIDMISTVVRKEVMGEGINDVSFVTGDSFFVSQPVKLLFPQQLMDPAGVISTLQINLAPMTSCFT